MRKNDRNQVGHVASIPLLFPIDELHKPLAEWIFHETPPLEMESL